MNEQAQPPALPARPPNRMPLVMSGLVYPGIGQFMQRRYVVGLIYFISFTIFTVMFLAILVREFREMYEAFRVALDTVTPPEPQLPEWNLILKISGVMLVIYAANLIDVWLAFHKSKPRTRSS